MVRSLFKSVIPASVLAFSVLAFSVLVWAVPDTLMTIAPSAQSGTTITAADENDRNNDVSTVYNGHSHADISSTSANTFTIGNGAAGNKDYAISDGTNSAAVRWDGTNTRWEVTNDGSTYLSLVTTTGTTTTFNTLPNSASANTILYSDGNSWNAGTDRVADLATGAGEILYSTGVDALAVLAAGTSGQVLQSNGAAAPSWVDSSDPTDYVTFYEEFLTSDEASTGAARMIRSQYAWRVRGKAITGTYDDNGLWEIDGDAAADVGEMFLSNGGTATTDIALPFKASLNPTVIINWRNDNGSASGANCYLGLFSDFTSAAAPTNGVYFNWDGNSRDINLITNAAGITTTDTLVNSDTATSHTFKLVFTGTTNIALTVDGGSVINITANIPSDDLGIAFTGPNSTANRGVIIDYIYVKQNRS